MLLLILAAILDRVTFNSNLMYLAELLNQDHPGQSSYVLLLAVVLHLLLSLLLIVLWRNCLIKTTYYRWVVFNSIFYSLTMTVAVLDGGNGSVFAVFFVISGLVRLEVPITLSLFYGNSGRSYDEFKYNLNGSEMVFAIGEVCSMQVISQNWTYPSQSMLYMAVVNLLPALLISVAYLKFRHNPAELAFDDEVTLLDNGLSKEEIAAETTLVLAADEDDVEDGNQTDVNGDIVLLRKRLVQTGNPSFTILEDQQLESDPLQPPVSLYQERKENGNGDAGTHPTKLSRGVRLMSTLIVATGFCSYALYSFFAYLLAFVLYHADYSAPVFALLGIVFFVTIVLFVWLSFRKISILNLAIRIRRCVFVLGMCAFVSWFLFIIEKNSPSAGHTVVHWVAMLAISYVLPAPLNILLDVQHEIHLERVCYADMILVSRLIGRTLGLVLTWASTFYLRLAPYFLTAFFGMRLYRSVNTQIAQYLA